MLAEVKPIDKTAKEKKELMKKYQGSASAPIDLNNIRQWSKHDESN